MSKKDGWIRKSGKNGRMGRKVKDRQNDECWEKKRDDGGREKRKA